MTCPLPTRRWLITDKGDPDARALVDGERWGLAPHYSRQTPGAPSWTRNGQNLVFITADGLSAWCTHRPKPGKATRPDKRAAWECTLFRNENALRSRLRLKPRFILSSQLIEEAVLLTCALWGPPPQGGLITFVRPECVRSQQPGRCYLEAGWMPDRPAADGKLCFRAPSPAFLPGFEEWEWKGTRGGLLRRQLEQPSLFAHSEETSP